MLNWLTDHKALLGWLTVASIAIIAAVILLAPLIIVRLPADYFARQRRPDRARPRTLVKIGKNVLGGALLIVGLIMLIAPGPGILVLLLGLILTDIPGKFRVERWLLTRPHVLRTINWLRRKLGREPMRPAIAR